MPMNPTTPSLPPGLPNSGFFQELALRAKLVLRLMGDRRVNFLAKVLPVGAVAYFLIPDLAIGPLDDAAILWLVAYLFVELCPDEVVAEHVRRLRNLPPISADKPDDDELVIEGEFYPRDPSS